MKKILIIIFTFVFLASFFLISFYLLSLQKKIQINSQIEIISEVPLLLSKSKSGTNELENLTNKYELFTHGIPIKKVDNQSSQKPVEHIKLIITNIPQDSYTITGKELMATVGQIYDSNQKSLKIYLQLTKSTLKTLKTNELETFISASFIRSLYYSANFPELDIDPVKVNSDQEFQFYINNYEKNEQKILSFKYNNILHTLNKILYFLIPSIEAVNCTGSTYAIGGFIDIRRCSGGPNDGQTCSVNSDCPFARCVSNSSCQLNGTRGQCYDPGLNACIPGNLGNCSSSNCTPPIISGGGGGGGANPTPTPLPASGGCTSGSCFTSIANCGAVGRNPGTGSCTGGLCCVPGGATIFGCPWNQGQTGFPSCKYGEGNSCNQSQFCQPPFGNCSGCADGLVGNPCFCPVCTVSFTPASSTIAVGEVKDIAMNITGSASWYNFSQTNAAAVSYQRIGNILRLTGLANGNTTITTIGWWNGYSPRTLCSATLPLSVYTPPPPPSGNIQVKSVLISGSDACNNAPSWADLNNVGITIPALIPQTNTTQAGSNPVSWNSVSTGTKNVIFSSPSGYVLSQLCFELSSNPGDYIQAFSRSAVDVFNNETITYYAGFEPVVAWSQVSGGDLVSCGDISQQIPPTVDPLYKYLNLKGPGGYPGIVTQGTSGSFDIDPDLQNDGKYMTSETNWLVKSYPKQVCEQDWYRYFAIQMDKLVPEGVRINTPNTITKDMLMDGDSVVVKKITNDPNTTFTISENMVFGDGESLVLFVDGNLKLNGKVTRTGTGFVAFIVNGNITVDGTVGSADTTPSLQGIYITNGALNTGRGTAITNERLNFKGTVIANSINLQRSLDFSGTNSTIPADKFFYDPELLFLMPDKMKDVHVNWKEVEP